MTLCHTIRACALALTLAVPASTVAAAEPDQSVHRYYIVSAPLTDVLTQITSDTGIDVDFEPTTVPYVTSSPLSGTGPEMVASLTQQFNLSMFDFNGRIYLSAANDQQTRIISNEVHSADEIRDAIARSGLNLGRFKVSDTANPNAIVLTGPSKLVGIVEAIVESLPTEPVGRRGREIVVMRGI